MGERYWDNKTARNYAYVDGMTGQVVGTIRARVSDRLFEAHAYDVNVGDYLHIDDARTAVEHGCVEVEASKAEAANLAKLAQAGGVTE